jgi:hypothetical protein
MRDTDKFCAECGTAVGGVAQQTQPTHWEYCEIVYELLQEWGVFRKAKMRFWAKAVGPNGVYPAAISDEFQNTSWNHPVNGGDEDVSPILNVFIKRLTAEGWEVLPTHGDEWYNYKFRRAVKG